MSQRSKPENEFRDAILKRMVQAPRKPHEPLKQKERPTTGKGRVRVGKSRS